MSSYVLLILSIILPLLWYSYARGSRGASLNSKIPEKYLIKNRTLILYFGNPKNRIKFWSAILHFVHMLLLLIVFIFYILFWINPSTYDILVSYKILFIYIIISAIITIPIIITDIIITKKYTGL